MKSKIRMTVPLQIVMDDFGWHKGKNSLVDGGPARTGINRDHEVEDITVVNKIGERIGMKIVCGLVLGEWDKDNVLRGMKHATKYEDNWDRKSYIDMDKANRFFDEIEKSDNIELAFHGLMHGYWVDGDNFGNPREFFSYDLPEGVTERRVDYPVVPVSADYVESHVEAYFKIYNSWNFTKKIRTFISPASLYKEVSLAEAYAERLEKYGFKFWKNGWNTINDPVYMLRSIAFLLAKGGDFVDWNNFDIDPTKLTAQGEDDETYLNAGSIIGSHWANFVYSDAKTNLDYVDAWASYFISRGNVYGYMLSKDIAFCASQSLYREFADLSFEGNKCVIDTSKMKDIPTDEIKNEFYISVLDELGEIRNIIGGKAEIYEVRDGHKIYRIVPEAETTVLEF